MKGILVQILVGFLLSVPTFMAAIGNTWTSYSLPILEGEGSPLGYQITRNDGSLLSSVIMLGSISSIVVVGYISDKIGRKRTEILTGLLFILAWLTITTAKTVTQLVIGRLMIGLGTGLHLVTGNVYISEMSQSSTRGALLTVTSFMYNVGALVSYIEGWFCSYNVVNYLNLTTAVCFLLILLCIKETPIYLLRSDKEKEAINSLKFYRGASTETPEIFDEIDYMKTQLRININLQKTDVKTTQLDVEKEKLNQEVDTVEVVTAGQKNVWRALCNSKTSQRALIILVVHMVLAVFMGRIAVQAYAGQFFTAAVPSLSSDLCAVILAIVIMIISGVSVVVIDLFPRRGFMMATCGSSAACMAIMATMLRWNWAPEWGIPIVMIMYCIAYNLGVANIPIVQIAESLPPQMNSLGTCVVMIFMCLANFAVLYTFQPAVDTFGLDGVFLMFAIIGLITTLVAFFFMRETKRVPFEIVKDMFEDGYLYRPQKL